MSVTVSESDIDRAHEDSKLAQVLYHDWESQTYDEKWSISFDERCVSYARDRFMAVAGRAGWPYTRTLEVGAGTGFFSLNLKKAGVVDEVCVTDISPGMVEAAQANAEKLGYSIEGAVADAESLPYGDATFDLVIGHAVIHHIPDVARALREIRRVLKPGGRLVMCGEPTRHGDKIARALSRATWQVATRVSRCAPFKEKWARPAAEIEESSHVAALEAVVDLHTFDPDELASTARDAGFTRVRTSTDELTAAWFGWPVRTLEHAINPERLGHSWAMFAYKSWLRLSAFDRALAAVVPQKFYYNVSLSGIRPSE